MANKIAIICLIILLTIEAGVIFYLLNRKPAQTIYTQVRAVPYQIPVKVKAEGVVSEYITDTVDNQKKTAYYHAVIDSERVKGTVDVAYNEVTSLFDVDIDLSVRADSIIVTNTIVKSVKDREYFKFICGITPLLRPTADSGKNLILQAEAGVRLMNKVDLSLVAGTDGRYGARLGYKF